MRENFHLSCRGKAKDANFLSSRSRGGGGRGLPEKIFEKRMQMVHSEPIFAEFVSIPPSPPPKKNCVYCFLQNSDLHDAGDFFPFAWGGGGRGESSRFFGFFFFLKNGYKWYILTPFIADCLLVFFVCFLFFFFFLKFHFCHESPAVQGMWCGSLQGIIWRSWVFFLCRKDQGGNTAPPPSKYFEKLMQYALRDDFSWLNFCILSKGIFGGCH